MNVFEESLREVVGALDLSEEERVKAVELAVEYGELQTRALAGEDLAEDIAIVEATMSLIVARNAVSVARAVRQTLVRRLTQVLAAVATAV